MINLIEIILIISSFILVINILNLIMNHLWFFYKCSVISQKLKDKEERLQTELLYYSIDCFLKSSNINIIRIIKNKVPNYVEVGNEYEIKKINLDKNFEKELVKIGEYFYKEGFIKNE